MPLKSNDAPGASLETAEFRRGPGGRPTREEAERRHRALLDAATHLFLEGGLNGTSIDAIAERAGVAKRFIYARYADKGELFVAAIGRFVEQRLSPLMSFDVPEVPVEIGLYEFGRRILALALTPEPLSVYRTLVIEASRFPSLAQLFIARNRERALGGLTRVLETYARRGAIELDDARMTAEHFFILVVGIAQRLALIGVREEPAQAERRLEAAIRLFLDGCRVKESPAAPPRSRR
ncbi:MAG: TetR/AcrR family transcriptional regulator [Hyphomicrobiales bacterium]